MSENFFQRSMGVREAVFSDMNVLERLAAFWNLEVISDAGGNHLIYRLGSVSVGDEMEYVAVRMVKGDHFVSDARLVPFGDLEFCAQEYERIYDTLATRKRVPSFAIGAVYATLQSKETPLLLVEDLTKGVPLLQDRHWSSETAMIHGVEYHVDFDLLDDYDRARKFTETPKFFGDGMRIDMTEQYSLH